MTSDVSYEMMSQRSRVLKRTWPSKLTWFTAATLLMPVAVVMIVLFINANDLHLTSSVDADTSHAINQVNDRFLSFALDTHSFTGIVKKFSNHHWNVLIEMAKYLTPAYLRIGGTEADNVLFNRTDDTHIIILPKDFLSLFEFLNDTDMKLVFDFNVLVRQGDQWNPDNAKEILSFFKRNGIAPGFELGNEPNSFPHKYNVSVSGKQLGRDFLLLKSLLNLFHEFQSAPLVGPDITNPHRLGVPPLPYLDDFLSESASVLSAVTWHQYYLNGRKATLQDFLSPLVMDSLYAQVTEITNVVRKYSPDIPIWLGETGSAYGSGAPNLSDTFASTFLLLDKLGLSAKLGINVIFRQSFLQGHYALIDNDLFPSPDFWISYLYKLTVGNDVFNVNVSQKDIHIRIYLHSLKADFNACLNQSEPISRFVAYGMNLGTNYRNVIFKNFSVLATYYLTAPNGDLQSRYILANGQELTWPLLNIKELAIYTNTEKTSVITLKPESLFFTILTHNS